MADIINKVQVGTTTYDINDSRISTTTTTQNKFLRDDGTWQEVSTSDTKVTQTLTTATTAYPILAKNTSATATVTDGARFAAGIRAVPGYDSIQIKSSSASTSVGKAAGFRIGNASDNLVGALVHYQNGVLGTTDPAEIGIGALVVGNNYALGNNSTTAYKGQIRIFSEAAYCNAIESNAKSSNKSNIIPNSAGYLAVGATAGVGGAATPVYMANTGVLTKVTSLDASLLSGLTKAQVTTALGYEPPQSDTDTKVTQTQSATNYYYPILAKGTSATATVTDTVTFDTKVSVNHSKGQIRTGGAATTSAASGSGFRVVNEGGDYLVAEMYNYRAGSSSTVGIGMLTLGNASAAGNTNTASPPYQGVLQVFGETTYCNEVYSIASTASRTNFLPNVNGVLAAGSTSGAGGTSTPVYMKSTGELASVTLDSTASNLINSLSVATANMSTIGYIITGDAASTTSSTFYKRPATSIVNSSLVKAALGTTTTTTNKVLSDTGAWVTVSDDNAFKLYGGIEIPANADLNSYITPGSYYIALTANAKTLLNNPYSAEPSTSMQAFRLYVVASLGVTATYKWQILRFYERPYQEWRRYSTNSGSSWSAWTNYLTDERVDQNVTDTNASYPVLLGATSGATTTYNGEARYSVRTSINALTGQFISKARPSSDPGVGGGYDIYNANGNISAKLWHYSDGTASAIGWGGLQVGNNIASGTAGNEKGFIYLYGSGAGKHQIDSDYATGTGYFHLPNISGTAAMLEGAQTFAGVKTFATTAYFGNGTTYYLGSGGGLSCKSLTAADAATFKNKIIGKAGAVSAGNYTTSVPTAAGVTGQIMFVLQ